RKGIALGTLRSQWNPVRAAAPQVPPPTPPLMLPTFFFAVIEVRAGVGSIEVVLSRRHDTRKLFAPRFEPGASDGDRQRTEDVSRPRCPQPGDVSARQRELTAMNESFSRDTGTFVIACECADATCVAMVELPTE